jgi:pyridoxamine 5'-phosphate oxidase
MSQDQASAERLSALRREYGDRGLEEAALTDDPLELFGRWLDDASVLHEPNAMVVASVSVDGRPSARMVLLKGLDERGFVFYTNYASRKGSELDARPDVALLFPWHDLQRQVRVEGKASRVTRQESEAYFSSRPRGSQIGAWASPQSRVVTSREALDTAYQAVEERFGEGEVPLPPYWGGYRVEPRTVEFWQGRKGRMHDRLVYHREDGTWLVERLAP